MKFSLLMSVYIKDDPLAFSQALDSIKYSSVKPSEVILVCDGAVTREIDSIIVENTNALNMKVIRLANNVGLGKALNAGLMHCNSEWIARFDSDDICDPERFRKQIAYIKENKNVSVLSGWIAEFISSPENIHAIRKVPLTHHQILSGAKWRNPFNHMAVMFKKSAVEAAGWYQADYLYEDYALWIRMLMNGELAGNISDILVYARTGNGMAQRRGGWKYLKSEIQSQNDFRKLGFISIWQFILNLLLRIPARIMPVWFRQAFYKTILRR